MTSLFMSPRIYNDVTIFTLTDIFEVQTYAKTIVKILVGDGGMGRKEN